MNNNTNDRLNFVIYLRAFAVLAVLFAHYYFFLTSQNTLYTVDSIVMLAKYGAGFGVHLFFLVSGFCITLTLAKDPNIVRFFTHRIFRIYPVLIFCAVLYQLSYTISPIYNGFSNNGVFFGILPMLKQLFFIGSIGQVPYGVTWTLYFEWSFYIFFGLAFFTLKGIRVPFIVMFSILTFLLLFVNNVMPSQEGLNGFWATKTIHLALLMNFMMIGSLFGLHYIKKITMQNLGFLVVFMLITLRVDSQPFSGARILLPLLLFSIFYFNENSGFVSNNSTTNKILQFFGNISYPLYLVHSLGYCLVVFLHGINIFISVVIALIVSIAASYMAHIGIERPGIKLGKKLFVKI